MHGIDGIDDNDLGDFFEDKYMPSQEEIPDSPVQSVWNSSDLLPQGWQYQKQADEVMFLSEEGTFLTQDDLATIYKFVTQKNKSMNIKTKSKKIQKLKENASEWKPNEYLPEGWLCKDKRDGEKGIFLKTDIGIILKTHKSCSFSQSKQ